MNRTNRRQQIMEFIACAPATAKCRVVIREEWPTGWTDNRPGLTWLKDRKRFIWESERNGWTNYYLYDLTGKLINPITTHSSAEAGTIVKVDEAAGGLYYMARDGDNYMKSQLHRVGLDGKGDMRLTNPAFNHSVGPCSSAAPAAGGRAGAPVGTPAADNCGLSPDGKYFVDVYQAHDMPPATGLVAIETNGGKAVAQVAKSDTSKVSTLGLRPAEQYTYLAADGKTRLFDKSVFRRTSIRRRNGDAGFRCMAGRRQVEICRPKPTCRLRQPRARLPGRQCRRVPPRMGKRVLDSIYLKLGVTEIDDMAEGIKALWSRPYFDKDRVGIYGTSYGGYTSALMILRHPEVVAASAASSPPTSWYHYDSIYTERYMWIPQENKDGYEAGNAMNFAKDLKGRLILYYGTADNNVHPNNTMQLIKALQGAGKSFELQVGPDAGHSGMNPQRMMEFFIEPRDAPRPRVRRVN
jgi:dipeptidyl-peptidase-4